MALPRYNPGMLLAQGAAAVGQQGAYNSQRAQDLQFISGEMDRRNQIAELAQQNQLDSQKLQMAGQMAAQRGQTATQPNAGGSASPFTQAVLNAKQLAIQGAGEDLDPAEKAAFSAEAMDPRSTALQFNNMMQKTVQQKQNMKAKNAAFQSAKDNIDPEDAESISAMIGDSQFGPQHVMQAIQQSAAKKQKNAQMQQDQQAKASMWQTAQTKLKDPTGLAPLVNDPRISGEQFHQAALHQYQQEQAVEKAKSLSLGQESVVRRNQIQQMNQSIRIAKQDHKYDIDWTQTDPDKATGGDANLKQIFMHVQDLQNSVNQMNQQEQSMLLHSPSTGRVFKNVNGQLQEITDQSDAR